MIVVSLLSSEFEYNTHWLERPTYLYVGLMIISGISYLSLIWPCISHSKLNLSFKWIFGLGLLFRLLFIPSTPIWEDDFYRYFFDGSLVKQGLNPYEYAPLQAFERPAFDGAEALGLTPEPTPPHPDLLFLQQEPLLDRVAYPHIKTIYPPVTQAVFALSQVISPFNLIVWRVILILFDLITFYLLYQLLIRIGKPVTYSAIYWLNPLLITETVNAGHMDVLLAPLLVAALLMVATKRISFSGIALALATGVKLWPLILAPSIFRPYLNSINSLFKVSLPLIFLTIILLSPQFLSSLNEDAGVSNYAQYWKTNTFLFAWLEAGITSVSELAFMPFFDPNIASRLIVGALVISIVIAVSLRPWSSIEELATQWLVIIATLFLLSPTGYPWYVIWFMPLLCIKPNKALLLLTALLPLYDLRYPLEANDLLPIFENVIVTIEFLPVLVLLVWYLWNKKPKAESAIRSV